MTMGMGLDHDQSVSGEADRRRGFRLGGPERAAEEEGWGG